MTIERTIAAPPELVFALYTDASRLHEWQPGVGGLRDQTGPLDQAGTSYVLDQRGPLFRIEVLRVEPPRLHQQLETLPWYSWVGTARFDPLPDGGTRFRYRYSARGHPRWLWSLVVTASALTLGRVEFNRLKRVAEETAQRSGSAR